MHKIIHQFYFSYINDVIIVLGFLVLLWYTVETYKIRKITARQKDLQLLPAVMFYIRREGGDRLCIKNIGAGSATAVQVMPAIIMADDRKLEFRFNLVDGNNTLTPQEERKVDQNFFVDGKKHNSPLSNFLAHYDPASMIWPERPEPRLIRVRFRDMTGQAYETVLSFSGNGIAVEQEPYRIKNI